MKHDFQGTRQDRTGSPGPSVSCHWWRRLPLPYMAPMKTVAGRTPCRCATCAPMKAGRFSSAEPGKAALIDQRPAQARGITMLQARQTYRRSAADIHRAYVGQAGDQHQQGLRGQTAGARESTRVGSQDHWGVWYAPARALEALWGRQAGASEASAIAPDWMTRAATRMARRQQPRGQQG